MELAFGLIFLVVILFIAMLPVIILFGLFGMVFKSIGAIVLFALKYLLPFGIVGFIVAKKRDDNEGLIFKEYLGHIGIAIGIGLVVLLIWLNIPVTPDFPEPEAVKLVNVSYEAGAETRTSSTDDEELIVNMVSSLNSAEYKRSLKEFIEEDEDDPEYVLTLIDSEEKEYKVVFCNSKVIGVKKGGIAFYYEMTGDSATVPQDWARNVFYLKEQENAKAIWQPFAEELFSTVAYNEQEQEIIFVIPEIIPGKYYGIDLYVEGARNYTGGEFERREFFIYEDEQKDDSWEAGVEYAVPLEDICFSRFYIKVDASYLEEPYMFDVFALLPEDRVYKPASGS